jgi:hypothetical protein
MQNRRPKHSNEHSHPLTLPCIRNPGAMPLLSRQWGEQHEQAALTTPSLALDEEGAAQLGAIAPHLTRATGICRRGNGLMTYITFGPVTITDANGSSTFIVEIE